MKTYSYFFFLLVFCVRENVCSEYHDNEVTIQYERVGNPDDTAKIVRPCPTYDLQCIRRFFHTHGKCTTAKGRVPDPFYLVQDAVYFPWVNISVVVNNVVVKGLNGRIEEFYINEDTDQLVIAIEFRKFAVSASDVYFILYRRAKEPVVTLANQIDVIYESVVITAIIPKIDDLQLQKAEVTAFSNDFIVPVAVGHGAYSSSDPQAPLTMGEYLSNIPLDIKEVYLTDAPYYASIYIQYAICDFGLDLTPR